MTTKFSIRADTVRLLLPYISNEVTRYYLNGIHVEAHEDGGVLAVATNGHVMGVVYDEEAVFESGETHLVISVGALEKALKPHRDDIAKRWVVIEPSEDGKTLARVVEHSTAEEAFEIPLISNLTKAIAADVLIDGTFPDWRRVMPNPKELGKATPQTAFRCDLLKAISDGYLKVTGDKGHGLQITQHEASGPALVRFSRVPDLPELFALLMPMRAADGLTEFPAWMKIQTPDEGPEEPPDAENAEPCDPIADQRMAAADVERTRQIENPCTGETVEVPAKTA